MLIQDQHITTSCWKLLNPTGSSDVLILDKHVNLNLRHLYMYSQHVVPSNGLLICNPCPSLHGDISLPYTHQPGTLWSNGTYRTLSSYISQIIYGHTLHMGYMSFHQDVNTQTSHSLTFCAIIISSYKCLVVS